MDRAEVDVMVRHQRELIAQARITTRRSFAVLARSDQVIRRTRSRVARLEPLIELVSR